MNNEKPDCPLCGDFKLVGDPGRPAMLIRCPMCNPRDRMELIAKPPIETQNTPNPFDRVDNEKLDCPLCGDTKLIIDPDMPTPIPMLVRCPMCNPNEANL